MSSKGRTVTHGYSHGYSHSVSQGENMTDMSQGENGDPSSRSRSGGACCWHRCCCQSVTRVTYVLPSHHALSRVSGQLAELIRLIKEKKNE